MWDVRGSARYYYRHRRVAGRAVRLYAGTGERAEAAAAEDAKRRAEKEAEKEARRAEEARLCAGDRPLLDLVSLADLLTRATLTASGYHQHDRGEWRKRATPRKTSGTAAMTRTEPPEAAAVTGGPIQ